ncbi:hypothetical protein J3Q64DRAFT_1758599 [Phycomyces blakesleeanus]|uniref:Uncharacterized protein n=1 Tax=Phycomyces blakesleeanus TaxID=4837 RepID=A0ABR3ASL3_PHYBL
MYVCIYVCISLLRYGSFIYLYTPVKRFNNANNSNNAHISNLYLGKTKSFTKALLDLIFFKYTMYSMALLSLAPLIFLS